LRDQLTRLAGALAALGGAIMALKVTGVTAPATASLIFLLIVLFVATTARLWTAVATSLVAMLCLNMFFLPPIGRLTVADPQNWVALIAFLAVGVVASQLAATARARARDAQRAELSSALLASLGHDVRTPLTAIRTAVSNLESGTLTVHEEREQARVARVEVERLGQLFDEVVDMARIDAGGVHPQRRWVTAAEVVEAAMAHAAAHLAGQPVEVRADDAVQVELDPRLTASALAHLLENAARYARDGVVRVTGRSDASGMHLEVLDGGAGLRPSELTRVFEPLFRGEDVRHRISGTGMGLAIARGLLAAEGGRVRAENATPRGARFSIDVPGRTRPAPGE
jgi:two-component system sensor histidine kinase KdpD